MNWQALGLIYRPDQRVPEATVRRLFKQERIQEMAREQLAEALTKKGITEEKVLQMYLQAFEKAVAVDNPSAVRAVAKDLSEMLEMTGGKGNGGGREPGYLLGYTGPPAGVLPEGAGAIEEATYEPMDQDED